METTSTPPVQARPKRPRRWLRMGLALVVALIALASGWWLYLDHSMRQEWDEAVAEAERDLPRWRLLEMEADRPVIADAENSALHVIAINRIRGRVGVNRVANYDTVFDKLPANVQLNGQQEQLIRTEFARIPKAVEMSRQLKDLPRGHFPIKWLDYGNAVIEDHHSSRSVADLLLHDAYLLAQASEFDQAAHCCLAMLNLGRSLEGELFSIALNIRLNIWRHTIETLERVVGQAPEGISDSALSELQTALLEETKKNHWLTIARGERAILHHGFDNLRAGKVDAAAVHYSYIRRPDDAQPTAIGRWLQNQNPSSLVRIHPGNLRLMNRAVEIAKLPVHERGAPLESLFAEMRKNKNFPSHLPNFLAKGHERDAYIQALLRSVASALACERYRRVQKSWPKTLSTLAKDGLLDAIPLDPFDGQPLRYRFTTDGAVVYSIGQDMKDNQGRIDRHVHAYGDGTDIGFRLWNPESRRQPPLPPIAEQEK